MTDLPTPSTASLIAALRTAQARTRPGGEDGTHTLLGRAADAIERLEAEAERLRGKCNRMAATARIEDVQQEQR